MSTIEQLASKNVIINVSPSIFTPLLKIACDNIRKKVYDDVYDKLCDSYFDKRDNLYESINWEYVGGSISLHLNSNEDPHILWIHTISKFPTEVLNNLKDINENGEILFILKDLIEIITLNYKPNVFSFSYTFNDSEWLDGVLSKEQLEKVYEFFELSQDSDQDTIIRKIDGYLKDLTLNEDECLTVLEQYVKESIYNCIFIPIAEEVERLNSIIK